jgi:hypothetical protein
MNKPSPCENNGVNFLCKFSPQENRIGLNRSAFRRASDEYCGDSFIGD